MDQPALANAYVAATAPDLGLFETVEMASCRESPRGWPEFHPAAEDIEREIAAVMTTRLSSALQPWLEGYSKVGHRNQFLWQWCRRGVEVTQLSCTAPEVRDAICDTRVLGIMLDVLLDDVADYQGDWRFLEHLLRSLEGHASTDDAFLTPHQRAYGRFTLDLWNEIQHRVKCFARSEEFAEILDYDYRQLFNVMRYSRLLNENPEMLNLVEHDLYLPHNMHMMISSTIDLMGSPTFDRSELGTLREAVWRAQSMGRIGNLVTTWQREIGEGDFTSGVFARALACGDLAVEDLRGDNRSHLESVIQQRQHERYFLDRWQNHRREILALCERCRSVDLAALVAGLQRLICLHLGSRGKK